MATETVQGIELDPVTAWASARIPGLKPPLTFSLIAGGHSNLTYRFVDAAGEVHVLRRPPLGHVLESAHDMGARAPYRVRTGRYRGAGAAGARAL